MKTLTFLVHPEKSTGKERLHREIAPGIWRGSFLSLELTVISAGLKGNSPGPGKEPPKRRRRQSLKLPRGWDLLAFQFVSPLVRIGKPHNPWWSTQKGVASVAGQNST